MSNTVKRSAPKSSKIKAFFGSESRPRQSLLFFVISCTPLFVSKSLAFATIWGMFIRKFESINIDHRKPLTKQKW